MATQPVVHAKLIVAEAERQGKMTVLRELTLESAGEDCPDAYRHDPIHPEDQPLNIVAAYSNETKEWLFQEVWGELFGLSSAVMNYNRTPRVLTAIARRWLMLMMAMYFDDASLQDISSAKGKGQRHMQALNRMIGVPFAAEKSIPLGKSADFLGLPRSGARHVESAYRS